MIAINKKAINISLKMMETNIDEKIFDSVELILSLILNSILFFLPCFILIFLTNDSPIFYLLVSLFVGAIVFFFKEFFWIHKRNIKLFKNQNIKINLSFFYLSVLAFKLNNPKDKNKYSLYFSYLFQDYNISELDKLLTKTRPKLITFTLMTLLIQLHYQKFSNKNLKYIITFYKSNYSNFSNFTNLEYLFKSTIIPFSENQINKNLSEKVRGF